MTWGQNALPQPEHDSERTASCQNCNQCITSCPFADGLSPGIDLPNEDALAKEVLLSESSVHNDTIGFYLDLAAGYSKEFRNDGSSGAIATWTLTKLIERGDIDAAFCVSESTIDDGSHFEYTVCKSTKEVRQAAKTRYYPSSFEKAISYALENPGRYAIVGLPCALKAVRLAQMNDPILKERIVFLVGIFCGGLKTRYYAEYLSASSGVHYSKMKNPEFRVKSLSSSADDYYFKCDDENGTTHRLRMRELGDMWGTGLFKPNVCDYCDDLTAELADISVGDAWFSPHREDGSGTSIIVVRSKNAKILIEEGENNKELSTTPISAYTVNFSQRGNINHRRKGLAYRLYLAQKRKQATPRKRVQSAAPRNPIFALIQRLRMRVRRLSHEAWQIQRETPGVDLFNETMQRDLKNLQTATRFSHKIGNAVHVIKKSIQK